MKKHKCLREGGSVCVWRRWDLAPLLSNRLSEVDSLMVNKKVFIVLDVLQNLCALRESC